MNERATTEVFQSTGRMINRRALVGGLSIGLLAAPLGVAAQSAGKAKRIAYLSPGDGRGAPDYAFDEALKQLGYTQDKDLVVVRRSLHSQYEAVNQTVQEMVRLNVDVIVTWAVQLSSAAKRETSTIPIVFIAVRGPVERGLVPSLARPGGNITGVSTYPVETIDPKLFELAKELLPQLSRVAVLSSSADPPGATNARDSAARTLGFKLTPIPFSEEKDIANVPALLERSRTELLIAPDTPLLYAERKRIIQFAAMRRLPVVYAFREAVEEGGLMALSTDLSELARRAAGYVDKILKGAKAGELPVEQPTTLQFAINLKTAKSLGLAISPSLLLRADRVIE